MPDQDDSFLNIVISIMAEGQATVYCDPAYNDCTQTVVQNTTAIVHYYVAATISDTYYAQLWDAPGMSGGNMVSELWRTTLTAGNHYYSVSIAMGTTPFNGSIRVGHVVG